LRNLEEKLRNKSARIGIVGLGYVGLPLALALHRPDNVDDKQTFLRLISAVSEISKRIPITFPVHVRTQKRLEAIKFPGQPWSTNH